MLAIFDAWKFQIIVDRYIDGYQMESDRIVIRKEAPLTTAVKEGRMVELGGSVSELNLNKDKMKKVAQSKASLLKLRMEQYYVNLVQEANQRHQRYASMRHA